MKRSSKPKIKTRRVWTRHPGQKVVPNKHANDDKKRIEEEALEEYEDERAGS